MRLGTLILVAFASGCVTTQGTSSGGSSVVEIIEIEAPEGELVAHVRGPRVVPPAEVDEVDEVEPDVDPVPAHVPAPVVAPAPVGTPAYLTNLHPELRKRGLALLERLTAEGIAVKLLMGYTPYVARKSSGPGGWASWHEFGLAFDLNLTKRKGLGDAKAHFDDDAETWRRIGAIAAELGLVWGGSWRSSYDPFHFEWHPGEDAVINKQDLGRFLRLAGRDGKAYQRVWTLFAAPDAANHPPGPLTAAAGGPNN